MFLCGPNWFDFLLKCLIFNAEKKTHQPSTHTNLVLFVLAVGFWPQTEFINWKRFSA